MVQMGLEHKYKELPRTPGVYIFKNARERVIYVGKAKVLKHRVASYFQKNLKLGTKTAALVSNIADLKYIQTESELEALILEAALIKKHNPKYNVALKDDKSYLYIVFRNDKVHLEGKEVGIPKLITARKTDLLKTDLYFGPFPHGNTAKYIVSLLRKVFPYRDCSVSKFNRYQKLGSPCLYGHLNLCQAPCIGRVALKDYRAQINRLKQFLRGGSVGLIREFERKMIAASSELEYEKAVYYRDVLKKFNYIRANFKSAEKYIENPNLLEDLAEEAMHELKDKLPGLSTLPKRIECYDISNISGKESVGSMVVAIDGEIDKSEYRRFRIKTKSSPDDYYMLKEVLARRLKREVSTSKHFKKWGMPDLIIIDGGKGQVSAIAEVLVELGLEIPLVGLAKRYETIVFIDQGKFVELNLSGDNEGQKLLIRLRDESHRFAQKYHHYLRLKRIGV